MVGCSQALWHPESGVSLKKSEKMADTHFDYREEIITNLAFLFVSF